MTNKNYKALHRLNNTNPHQIGNGDDLRFPGNEYSSCFTSAKSPVLLSHEWEN
jgi:hypothetical protein